MTLLSPYEYQYNNDQASHTCAYLLPPLLSMIPSPGNVLERKIRILDLGCGNGSLTNALANYGYEMVGIEESSQGIEIARHNFPSCQFIQGSIYNLPYQQFSDLFDVIISTEVIEHLFYPRELVRSAQKCLRPGGSLILTTPYHGYLKNLILSLTGKMDGHFTALWDGGHIKFFSVSTLTKLLQEEDFTNITFKFAGRVPYFWKSMLCCSQFVQKN